MVSSDGSPAQEIIVRVIAASLKWRSLTGVLCDKNILGQAQVKDLPDRGTPCRALWCVLACHRGNGASN
ncbi:hypothetical protein Y032_0041g451 [Ancylostoma ceylanicum]|uniref:Uncharacterized protein n=1 Tax=Ancylostoma ceylanicum TaxID=53326 RepID=A0A016UGI7_9BILA|nr:hypothetical protein Y032_0041g451 [Ancylostoma ceylanicum]